MEKDPDAIRAQDEYEIAEMCKDEKGDRTVGHLN